MITVSAPCPVPRAQMAGQPQQPFVIDIRPPGSPPLCGFSHLMPPGHGLCYGGRLSATALLSTRLRSPYPQPTNSQPWLGLPRTYRYFLPPGSLNSRSQLSAQPPASADQVAATQPAWLRNVARQRGEWAAAKFVSLSGSSSASTFPDRASTFPAIAVSCNLAAIITLIGVASPPFRSVAMGLRPKRAHSRVHVHRARFRVFQCHHGAASYRAGVGAEVASFLSFFLRGSSRRTGF